MEISITVEINETEPVFNILTSTEKISIDIVFNKYKFDILTDSYEKRLEYIAREISLKEGAVLVGNACYNLAEIKFLQMELSKYCLCLNTVYIPSPARVHKRLLDATENARLHGRWIGSSETEVEVGYDKFKSTLREIREGLSNTRIKVVEC